ncbi:MAG: hypothetical protein AAB573_03755 [Patescibacteria group bacterium]
MGVLERIAGRTFGVLARSIGSHTEKNVLMPAQIIVELLNDKEGERIRHWNAYEEKMWAMAMLGRGRWLR